MEKLELNKPRQAIEISNNVTLVQRKVFNCLMIKSKVAPQLDEEGYFTISVKELCHLTGYRQNDFLYLDKQLEEMQTTLISWAGKKEGHHGRIQFLGEIEYEDGILKYSFSRKLLRVVKDSTQFGLIDIGSMSALTSKYSLALYEFCTRFREFKHGTGFLVLKDVKVLLCGDPEVYPEFKVFNRDVLKPSIKEVNDKTDIHIDMITEKKGRSIHAVKFYVSTNSKYKDILLEKPRDRAKERLELRDQKANPDIPQKPLNEGIFGDALASQEEVNAERDLFLNYTKALTPEERDEFYALEDLNQKYILKKNMPFSEWKAQEVIRKAQDAEYERLMNCPIENAKIEAHIAEQEALKAQEKATQEEAERWFEGYKAEHGHYPWEKK